MQLVPSGLIVVALCISRIHCWEHPFDRAARAQVHKHEDYESVRLSRSRRVALYNALREKANYADGIRRICPKHIAYVMEKRYTAAVNYIFGVQACRGDFIGQCRRCPYTVPLYESLNVYIHTRPSLSVYHVEKVESTEIDHIEDWDEISEHEKDQIDVWLYRQEKDGEYFDDASSNREPSEYEKNIFRDQGLHRPKTGELDKYQKIVRKYPLKPWRKNKYQQAIIGLADKMRAAQNFQFVGAGGDADALDTLADTIKNMG